MSARTGYQRATTRSTRHLDALWAEMRRRRKPWTAAQIAAATGVSGRHARRYARALARAGLIECVSPAATEGGRYRAALYLAPAGAAAMAPGTRRSDGASEPEAVQPMAVMTPAQFRAARQRLGLSARQMAEAIGYRDGRSVRRLETDPERGSHRIVTAEIADRVRALLQRATD